MSNSEEPQVGIDDDSLPDDLQPSDDNPLAEGLDDGETVDDLLDAGKEPERSDESEESDSDASDAPDADGDESDES